MSDAETMACQDCGRSFPVSQLRKRQDEVLCTGCFEARKRQVAADPRKSSKYRLQGQTQDKLAQVWLTADDRYPLCGLTTVAPLRFFAGDPGGDPSEAAELLMAGVPPDEVLGPDSLIFPVDRLVEATASAAVPRLAIAYGAVATPSRAVLTFERVEESNQVLAALGKAGGDAFDGDLVRRARVGGGAILLFVAAALLFLLAGLFVWVGTPVPPAATVGYRVDPDDGASVGRIEAPAETAARPPLGFLGQVLRRINELTGGHSLPALASCSLAALLGLGGLGLLLAGRNTGATKAMRMRRRDLA